MGNEIQGEKEEKGGKKEKKKKEKEEGKKKKEEGKKKKEGRKKKEGKKRLKLVRKFAGVPLGKFLKINRYLKPEFESFRLGEEALL